MIKLTDTDRELLRQLAVQDIKGAAVAMHTKTGTLEVRLSRIRRKYRTAVRFKSEIETLLLRNPNLRDYIYINKRKRDEE